MNKFTEFALMTKKNTVDRSSNNESSSQQHDNESNDSLGGKVNPKNIQPVPTSLPLPPMDKPSDIKPTTGKPTRHSRSPNRLKKN